MQNKTLDATPNFETTQALQEAITEFNKAFIHMMLTAARTGDPMAPLLLGLPSEVLVSYQSTPSFSLLAAHRFGIPLAVARFSDPAKVREIFKSGFSQAQLLSELSKNLELKPIYKTK